MRQTPIVMVQTPPFISRSVRSRQKSNSHFIDNKKLYLTSFLFRSISFKDGVMQRGNCFVFQNNFQNNFQEWKVSILPYRRYLIMGYFRPVNFGQFNFGRSQENVLMHTISNRFEL